MFVWKTRTKRFIEEKERERAPLLTLTYLRIWLVGTYENKNQKIHRSKEKRETERERERERERLLNKQLINNSKMN